MLQLSVKEFLISLTDLLDELKDDELHQLLYDYCEHNLQAFAEIFFPHYCTKPWNRFHLKYFATRKTGERAIRRAWASPRGSAKSTLVSLITPIHDHCYGLEHFILIIANTDDQAVLKVKDIRDEILTNQLLRDVYGCHFDKKNPPSTEFIVYGPEHKTFFQSAGAGSQIRGIRFGPHRPTKVIFDDFEHSERVSSERQRQKLTAYFREDVGKVGDEQTNIEGVGTILHRKALLADLMRNPIYLTDKFRSIISWPERRDLWDKWEQIYMNIAAGEERVHQAEAFYEQHKEQMLKGFEVMWPEKEPPIFLMKERLEIGHASFMKEKQNDPLGDEDRVFEKMLWYSEHTLSTGQRGIVIEQNDEFVREEIYKHNSYGVIDPSTGQTKPSQRRMSDFACVLHGYQDHVGRVLVHSDWTKRKPPTHQINAIFDAHDKYNFVKFGVETNLYRNLLMENLIEEKRRREKHMRQVLRLAFFEIENTENKDKRIHRMEPKCSHGWVLFNRALSHEFQSQMDDYPQGDHDDCPDALDMLYNLIHNKYKASPISLNAMSR